VADPRVLLVEVMCVKGVQVVHPTTHVRERRADQEVDVIPHEAIRKAPPLEAPDDIPE
jgi:hypothetical protein